MNKSILLNEILEGELKASATKPKRVAYTGERNNPMANTQVMSNELNI
jgi:hypothetical protein